MMGTKQNIFNLNFALFLIIKYFNFIISYIFQKESVIDNSKTLTIISCVLHIRWGSQRSWCGAK